MPIFPVGIFATKTKQHAVPPATIKPAEEWLFMKAKMLVPSYFILLESNYAHQFSGQKRKPLPRDVNYDLHESKAQYPIIMFQGVSSRLRKEYHWFSERLEESSSERVTLTAADHRHLPIVVFLGQLLIRIRNLPWADWPDVISKFKKWRYAVAIWKCLRARYGLRPLYPLWQKNEITVS